MFKHQEIITLNAVMSRIKESGASVILNAEDYAGDRAIVYNLSETDWINEEGNTYGFLYWCDETGGWVCHPQGNLTLKQAMAVAFNYLYSETTEVLEGSPDPVTIA